MKGPDIAKLAAVALIGGTLCFGGSIVGIDSQAQAQKIKKNSDWDKKDTRSGSSSKSQGSSSSGGSQGGSGIIRKDSGSNPKSSGSSSIRKDDSSSKSSGSTGSASGIRKNDSWDKRDSSSSSSIAKREREEKGTPSYDTSPNDSPNSIRIRREDSGTQGSWEQRVRDINRAGSDGRDNGYSKPGRTEWQPRKPEFISPGKGGIGDAKRIRVTEKYRGPKYIFVVDRYGSPWWYYDWDPWWWRQRSSFGIYFYYGSYCCDPYPLELWSFPDRCWPSLYCFYRTCPTWIFRNPSIVVNAFIDYDNDYRIYHDRYSSYPAYYGDALRDCIDDIRRSWLTGDPDYLTSRLDDWRDIRIYFDNRYCYSMPAQDYYEMTLDAISTTRTLDFDLLRSFERRSGEVFCVFRHTYEDWDGARRTVYLSYLLRKINGWWRIVAVGSSESPIYGMPDTW
jgi:hypothetical protein